MIRATLTMALDFQKDKRVPHERTSPTEAPRVAPADGSGGRRSGRQGFCGRGVDGDTRESGPRRTQKRRWA